MKLFDWFNEKAEDKKVHMLGSVIIVLFLTPAYGLIWASIIALIAGLLVEAYQKLVLKKQFSFSDLNADIFGIIVGILLATISARLL